MVKLIFLCRRRADITHDEYVRRLLDGHVPLALRHHPRMRRYVVNIVEGNPAGAPELDSIGLLCFDSPADFHERLYDSPAGARIVAQDVRGFMGNANAYVTTEHVHLCDSSATARGAHSPRTKLVCLLRRRAGVTHADFVEHWLTHGAAPVSRGGHGLVSYTTDVVDADLSNAAPPLDGIAELGFAALSLDDEPVELAGLARFVGSVVTYRVAEYVQK